MLGVSHLVYTLIPIGACFKCLLPIPHIIRFTQTREKKTWELNLSRIQHLEQRPRLSAIRQVLFFLASMRSTLGCPWALDRNQPSMHSILLTP